MNSVVYVVCRLEPYGDLFVLGVFDDRNTAIEACTTKFDFVGPVRMNEKLPDNLTEWPGAFYPLEKR